MPRPIKLLHGARKLALTPIFLLLFYAVGDAAFFERSVFVLIYAVYINLDRGEEVLRNTILGTLGLKHFQQSDGGSDTVLTASTAQLLEQLQADLSTTHIMDVRPEEVVSMDNARIVAGVIEDATLCGMLIWIAISYFA